MLCLLAVTSRLDSVGLFQNCSRRIGHATIGVFYNVFGNDNFHEWKRELYDRYNVIYCSITHHSYSVHNGFRSDYSFIVGGHQKNVNLIRGFYIFCIGELILTTLLILVAVGLSIAYWVESNTTEYLVFYAVYLVSLVVQAYFILLLRSQVIKMKSSGEFRFVNNSAEAETQCMMTSKQNEAKIENV